MKPFYKDQIYKYSGNIFFALDTQHLIAMLGREKALELKEIFLKIYRDSAETKESFEVRQVALEKFREANQLKKGEEHA